MRVVCARSDLGMLVNMRWNMMPALENRLGRFLSISSVSMVSALPQSVQTKVRGSGLPHFVRPQDRLNKQLLP